MIRIDWRGFAHTRENAVHQAMVLLGRPGAVATYRRVTGEWPTGFRASTGAHRLLRELGWAP